MSDDITRHPIDPDVDLHVPEQRFELRRAPWAVLAAISAGGVAGTLARYGLTVAFPHRLGGFPWATFVINVAGCLLIGVLMVAINEAGRVHRLVRPFLGVGVLGGFTTFSAYIVDTQQAIAWGTPATGLAYLAATLGGALLAVYAGVNLARRFLRHREERPR
ncbi:fluoride efflux transporter FluC [Actinomadura alba]|uniref:fluoride efflux transporter FluC n=1 Tax=Actinomadura alba TaxID=406431 RepID=UPI0028A975BB|nr:CrcB family protein [Actinomadura alba]